MTRFHLLVCYLVATVLLMSCGVNPGSFSMSFLWEKTPDKPVHIWVRVEERTDPAIPGKILASAGPELFDGETGIALELDDIPNGSDRYVVAEVREGPNPTLPIIYYGLSESFELVAGKNTHVEVPMSLKIPEAQAVDAVVGLLFGDQIKESVGVEDLHNATIVLESVQAASVVIANDASFSNEAIEVTIPDGAGITCNPEEKEGQTWNLCEYPGWDLANVADDQLDDQQYTVYMKFIDRYGYESDIYRASVILDSQGPKAILGSVSPQVAHPGADIFLNVTFHEQTAEDESGLKLNMQPELPDGSSVSLPQRIGTSTSYLWTLHLTEEWPEDVTEFQFTLDSSDKLGNKFADQQVVDQNNVPVTLLIDPEPPKLLPDEGEEFSASLLGLPDLGETFSFEFAIEETNPQEISNGEDGSCTGICPVVRLGNSALGTVLRKTELDDPDHHRVGFRYEYVLKDEDFVKKDSEPVVTVTWSDLAGNILEEIIDEPLRFDLQRPDVLSCSLVPEFGNATSVFTYTLTASEALAGPPALDVDAITENLFTNPPIMSDNNQTWEWQQAAEGLPSQEFSVSAELTDNAGNVSDGFICNLEVAVDGEPPLLVQEADLQPNLWTLPEVLNSQGQPTLTCGDQYELHVSFAATEGNGIAEGYPDVRLAVPGKEIALEQVSSHKEGPNTWTYEYFVTIDTTKHKNAEGSWPVRVTLQDTSANETVIDTLADLLVKLDFTPPEAECSLIPAPSDKPYAIGDKVMLQISALEELPAAFIPSLSETFDPLFDGPFFLFDEGTKYRFSRTILDTDENHTFDVAVSLTDLVGNSTQDALSACTAGSQTSGVVDGAAPALTVISVSVDEGAIDPDEIPLMAGRKIDLTVHTTGTGLPPAGTLGSGDLELLSQQPLEAGEGTLEWHLTRTLDGTEGEGVQYAELEVNDESGNQTDTVLTESPFTLDFSAPVAQCKSFPPAAKVGDTITVTVNTSEPLAGGLPEFTTGSDQLVFIEPAADEAATNFEFTHFITENEALQTEWSYEVTLTDIAGNQTDGPDCTGGGNIDAEPPSIPNESATVWTDPVVLDNSGEPVFAVGPGDALHVEFDILESQAIPEDGIEVFVDIPGTPVALSLSKFEPEPDGSWSVGFQHIFEPDDFDDAGTVEGIWPLKAQVEDQAGNTTVVAGLGDELIRIDFTPPQADCSLIPVLTEQAYGTGHKILIQGTALEELSSDPADEPELVETWNPPLKEDDSPYFKSEQKLRFGATVEEGDGERSFTADFILTDLVGNSTPDGMGACLDGSLTGLIDGTHPAVHESTVTVDDGAVDFTTIPLRAGRLVAVSITIENTSLKPTVKLAESELESQLNTALELGNDLYQWQFTRTLDGSEGDGEKLITVSGEDEATNSYSYTDADNPLHLDFTPPTGQCALSPSPVKLGDTIDLVVTTSEPLATGLPDLQVGENLLTLTSPQPDMDGLEFAYYHPVTDEDGDIISWTYSVALTDRAGNESDGPVCSGEGAIDALLPQIDSPALTTVPFFADFLTSPYYTVGDSGIIKVSFNVIESQPLAPGFPKAFLDVPGAELAFELSDTTQMQPDTVKYDFVLEISKADHLDAEGIWPLRGVVQDLAGNHAEEAQLTEWLVQLDFTPPDASCTLIPAAPDAGYPIDQKVTLQISPLVPLQEGTVPIISEEFDPVLEEVFLSYENGTLYRFSGTVEEGVDRLFAFSVGLTDRYGNSTLPGSTACLDGVLAGSFDGVVPVVSDVELVVDEGTINPAETPLRETRIVDVILVISGTDNTPTVTMGSGAFEAVDGFPVDLGQEQFQWKFERQLTGSEGEGLQKIQISGHDDAGNAYGYTEEDKTAVFDFTPPSATCKISKNDWFNGEQIILLVTASEPLADEQPEVHSDEFSFSAGLPEYPSPYEFFYTIGVPLTGSTTWSYSVTLIDLAGNTQDDDAACEGGGNVDEVPPLINSAEISTNPVVTDGQDQIRLMAGPDNTIIAEFQVQEDQGLSTPEVYLDVPGNAIPFNDVELTNNNDGTFDVAAQLTLNDNHLETAEGAWPVRVTVTDIVGNSLTESKLGDEVVQVDFTKPTATCSLVPATDGTPYPISQKILFQVAATEELAVPPELTETLTPEGFEGSFFELDNGSSYRFSHTVAEGEGDLQITVKATLTDLVGNQTDEGLTACEEGLLSATTDTQVPVLSDGVVSTLPVVKNSTGDTVIAAAHSAVIQASFTVTETQGIASGYPVVNLDVGSGLLLPFTQTSIEETEPGTYLAIFRLTADYIEHALNEGSWPVRVTVSDTAGNTVTENSLGNQYVLLDFTPPTADCSLIPAAGENAFGVGQGIALQVTPFEGLQFEAIPTIHETSDLGEAFLSYDAATAYRFSGTVEEGDGEHTLQTRVTMTDIAGNTTADGSNACVLGTVSFDIDGATPVVDSLAVSVGGDVIVTPGSQPLAAETILTATIVITGETETPTVNIGGGSMIASINSPTALGNNQFEWTFTRTLDGSEGEGYRALLVTGFDAAGNTYSGTKAGAVLMDFTPPYMQCVLNDDLGKAGDLIRATFLFSEVLDNAPELDLTHPVNKPFEFTFNADESDPDASPARYVYDYTVPDGLANRAWSMTADAVDKAGNALVEPCSVSGVMDGTIVKFASSSYSVEYQDPDAQTWHDSTPYMKLGARITINFSIVYPYGPDHVEVTLGSEEITDYTYDNNKSYTFTYELPANENDAPFSDNSLRPIIIKVWDDVGNENSATPGILIFDYTAPTMLGESYLERCDAYTRARVSQSDIYVKLDGYGCNFPGGYGDPCDGSAEGPVRITFSASEPLDHDYTRIFISANPPLEFAEDRCASTGLVYATMTPVAFQDAEKFVHWNVRADLQDRAGNRTEFLDVGNMRFDYTAPETPDVSTADRIVYTRIPWGADASFSGYDTDGESHFSVEGEADAVESEALVSVYSVAETSADYQVGWATASADGSFGDSVGSEDELTLQNADRPYVYVSATDKAGNESAAAIVRDVVWVATMNNKVAGSTFENPNQFLDTEWLTNTPTPRDGSERDEDDDIGLYDEETLSTTGADLAWVKRDPLDQIQKCSTMAMAFDQVRGEAVLFGGRSQTDYTYLTETWIWDGVAWQQALVPDPEGDGDPYGRRYAEAAYDSKRERVVLFGGYKYNGPMDDTWEWDGSSWEEISSGDGDGLGTRRFHRLVYDTIRGRVLMFGGHKYGNHLWKYVGSDGWDKITPEDPEDDGNPNNESNSGVIQGPGMAFDFDRDRLVLVGGGISGTWEYDGTSWEKVSETAPPARIHTRMVYSREDTACVLYGGAAEDDSLLGDTWEWDGSSWTQITIEDPEDDGNPDTLRYHSMYYDTFSSQVVVFGGNKNPNDVSILRNSSWAYTGSSWKKLGPIATNASGPPERQKHGLLFHEELGQIIEIGGNASEGTLQASDEVWGWSGTLWSVLDTSNEPSERYNFSYAYDSDRDQAMVYGGTYWDGNSWEKSNGFWEMDSSGAWVNRGNSGANKPDARDGHSMVYDSDRQRVVTFSGTTDDNDTWERNPATTKWTLALAGDGTAPDGRRFSAMTYDPVREVTVLFGGETTSGVSSDTWHWNGSSWSEVTPADPEGDGKPSARDSHTMAWDKTRQKSVLFGGFGYTVFNSTWAWDGTSWEYLEVADPFGDTNPVPRSDARMAYDQNRESLVLTGGNIAAHDTWEGLSAFYQRPGHIFRVPFIAANNCDKPDLTSITVNWIAGARGWSATGEERAGINMRLWDHGEWDSLGFYYTPTPETPMLMSRTFDDPLQVARILTGDYQTLSVLMRNRFYNYWTGAEIVTDYVEAIFRYRIDADAPDACE